MQGIGVSRMFKPLPGSASPCFPKTPCQAQVLVSGPGLGPGRRATARALSRSGTLSRSHYLVLREQVYIDFRIFLPATGLLVLRKQRGDQLNCQLDLELGIILPAEPSLQLQLML